MKKVQGIMWGLVLVALGVILGGNALNWWNVDLFFDGWWTLFIIVPCTIGFITEKGERIPSLVGVIIGVLLLLASQDVISFDILWKILLPIAVIIIGLAMICKNLFNKKYEKEINKLNEKLKNEDAIGAVFSGQNINFAGEEFEGKTVGAVFGGMKLDLRKAKINSDVVINAKAIFGGVEILVPDDVKIKIKSNSAFGGITNKKENTSSEKAPTIYINGTAVFGGIDIK